MIEKHPYTPFVPKNSKYLILGSFPAKPSERGNWYYVNPKNQFWSILEETYKVKLDTKRKKLNLLKDLKIAITDIIFSCSRKNDSNLDKNLTNIIYNTKTIKKILTNINIKKIYFTSRFVENSFKKLFSEYIKNNQQIELTYLPSPSPRYASMSFKEKVIRYNQLLPKKI